MKDHNDQDLPLNSRAITSLSVVATRVGWLFVGPCALVLALYGVATTGSDWACLH